MRSAPRYVTSPPTRPCSSSRANRSGSCAPTSGRRAVLIANSNLVPDWANWTEFRRLESLGLTMYGQMTAGSWIYIGTQGILQGTYECFAEIARRRFGGSLAGTITVTAGLGGMGGAQPLAITMNGGVALCVDVDPERVARRIDHRYLDEVADSLDDAVTRCVAARDARRGALGRRRRQRGDGPAGTRRAGLSRGHRHRPDQRSRSAVVRARRPHGRGDHRAGPQRSGRARPAGPVVDGGALRGDGRLRRPGRRGIRLRQQPAHRGRPRRVRPGIRLSRVPAGLHQAAVLRGQGTVPVGRPVRRSGGHRRNGSGGARGVPRRRGAAPLDRPGR